MLYEKAIALAIVLDKTSVCLGLGAFQRDPVLSEERIRSLQQPFFNFGHEAKKKLLMRKVLKMNSAESRSNIVYTIVFI